MLVCDVTHTGQLRGYADVDEEKLAQVMKEKGSERIAVPALFGEGYLAFTMDSKLNRRRYQGIVDLSGETLTDCVHHYFHQSEQLETVIKVFVDDTSKPGAKRTKWRGAALMLQRLPLNGSFENEEGEEEVISREITPEQEEQMEEDWRRALIFMNSAEADEMLDKKLAPETMLFRLFNEDGVRVYEPLELTDKCSCNAQRVETVIRSLTDEEIDDLKKQGEFSVVCQFCARKRVYSDEKLAKIRAKK